jgi:ABC-type sugar transport system permease subunit
LQLGLVDGGVDWMAYTLNARFVLVLVDVWEWTPFLFIILLPAFRARTKK